MSLKIAELWNFEPGTDTAASSEAVDFPSDNMLKATRAKTWRSAGNFVITAATNDALDFDDGGGEFNATITAGTYSTDALASEIKTQMEAVGGETYTITFSESTGKWTIGSSGATFNILWSSGTNSASSVGTTLGYDVSGDDSAGTSYTGASIALHTEEWIALDLGTWGTNSVDAAAIFFDPETGPQFSPSAELRLQASQTLAFAAPPVDIVLTIDEDYSVITHFFSSSEIYRYWRVKIVDPANPDLHVEVPQFVVGQYVALSQSPEIGYTDPIVDRTRIQTNDFGNEFFDILPSQNRGQEFRWQILNESDKLLLKQLYLKHGRSVPLLSVIDPQELVFSNKDESILYARLDNDFNASQRFYTFWDFSMSVREVF